MPFARASANRVLGYALLASISVHGLLLLLEWPQFQEALKAPVELLVRLVEPPAPPAPPAPPSPPQPVAERPAPVKPKPRVQAPRPAPLPDPVPAPQQQPSEPSAPVAAPAPAPAPDPLARAAPLTPAAPAAPPAVSGASLLAQYRAALLDEARKQKRYPLAALDNGWEGEVVVRMVVGADGSLAALTVRAGSGHAVLDRQALEMFRKAKPLVPVPDALLGKSFALELRAVFNLKDQGSG